MTLVSQLRYDIIEENILDASMAVCEARAMSEAPAVREFIKATTKQKHRLKTKELDDAVANAFVEETGCAVMRLSLIVRSCDCP